MYDRICFHIGIMVCCTRIDKIKYTRMTLLVYEPTRKTSVGLLRLSTTSVGLVRAYRSTIRYGFGMHLLVPGNVGRRVSCDVTTECKVFALTSCRPRRSPTVRRRRRRSDLNVVSVMTGCTKNIDG